MPSTASISRPATARQLDLLQRLANERGVTLEGVPSMSASEASGEIDRLIAMPNAGGGVPTLPLPGPVDTNRTGRMLLAGQITATVTLANGEHVTLKARTIKRSTSSTNGWAACEMGAEGSFTRIVAAHSRVRIARVNPDLTVRFDRGVTDGVKDAVRALFADAAGQPVELRLQVADRCGRCSRELTDPVSIDRGIGPECIRHATGSHHARVLEALNAVADGLTTPSPVHMPRIPARVTPPVEVAAQFEDEADEQAARRQVEATAVDAAQAAADQLARVRANIARAFDALGDVEAGVEALNEFDRLLAGARA